MRFNEGQLLLRFICIRPIIVDRVLADFNCQYPGDLATLGREVRNPAVRPLTMLKVLKG